MAVLLCSACQFDTGGTSTPDDNNSDDDEYDMPDAGVISPIACEPACAASERCVAGQCECRPGLVRDEFGECTSETMSLTCDSDAASKQCPNSAPLCQEGTCVRSCRLLLSACDGTCRDTWTDSNHCGECWNECDDDAVCFLGKCVESETEDECKDCDDDQVCIPRRRGGVVCLGVQDD